MSCKTLGCAKPNFKLIVKGKAVRVESFEVSGLNGRQNKISARFSKGVNILTGRNGAGKTSLLKLLWYIMSGNIAIAVNEVNFVRATLRTDLYEIVVHRINLNTCRIELTLAGTETQFFEDEGSDDEHYWSAEDRPNQMLQELGGSVFFPTFRRIEGGFTLNSASAPARPTAASPSRRNPVEEGLLTLSRKLSNGSHIFVAAISTVDIVGILLRQYTDLSEMFNKYQQETSQQIIQTIKEYKSDETDVTQINKANNVLDQIRVSIEEMDVQRASIMTPIEEIRSVVEGLFKHTGITFDRRLSFGDAAGAVNSNVLSAGEKQMLSFICYNAFYQNSAIFIDEPELSLHVDWQRQLFPILQKQQTSNQFIVATHSPFIYSKYPDNEISVDEDRGDRGN